MAEQAIDLRSTLPVLRRHRRTLAAAATVGAAAGVGCLLLWPPMYSSASQVLLPPVQSAPDSSGQTTRDVETTVRVATSEVVVGPAAKALKPPMSPSALARQVKASAPSNEILEIEAKAETPGRAREIADAVAKAEVTYVTEASSSLTAAQQAELATRRKNLQASLDKVNDQIDKTTARKRTLDPASSQAKTDASALARLTSEQANLVLQLDEVKSRAAGVQPTAGASIIQAASPAKRPGLVQRFVLYAMLGILVALTAASALLLAVARRDRRVRYRDQIADAVGSPVMVSVRSRVPRTAAGWKSLLEDYDPGVVDGWAFRQALRQLESEESGTKRRRPGQRDGTIHHPLSITVVTFSDDLRALAVGPQLAAYAASTGIRTRLVAARGQDSAAPLWAACSGGKDEELRPGLLVSTRYREQDDVELTVVLAVVDRRDPELADLPVTAVSIMALSPGVATVEDLARTAVTADDAAMRIAGVIVADPDALDKTTGRLLQHERAQQVPLPTRLTGMGAPAAAVSKPARGNAGPPSTRSSPGRGSTGRPGGSNSRRRQG